MKKFFGFVFIFAADVLLLWFANLYWPNYYVLLPFISSWWLALIVSALVWTAVIWFTQPVAVMLKIKLKKGLGLMVAYLIANFIALWGIARIGLGFGVKSFVWVFALAFVANIAQFLIWLVLTKFKLAEM